VDQFRKQDVALLGAAKRQISLSWIRLDLFGGDIGRDSDHAILMRCRTDVEPILLLRSKGLTPERAEADLYPVEIIFNEYAEDALTARMTAMREWLDHRHFEPSTFRHTFTEFGLLFQVYFKLQTEAEMFAREFDGRSVGEQADIFPKAAEPEAAID
jgi:hypothetical protein